MFEKSALPPNNYRPSLWMRSGHLNTIWASIGHPIPLLNYRRQRCETLDGDFIDLDWLDGPSDAPLLIALHGLEGSSDSPYIQRLMAIARSKGWRALAVNARGCSGVDNRGLQTYHAAYGDDLDFVLQRIEKQHGQSPSPPIVIVGYSLGGSQLANYLGRNPGKVPAAVKAACLVSAPLELAPGAVALRQLQNQVYTWYFLLSLRRKVRQKLRAHPSIERRAHDALQARSLEDFDSAWTAPIHGYADAADYYARAASAPYLREIQVPTCAMHAQDDPFVVEQSAALDRVREAPNVQMDWLRYGGHVGFVDALEPYWLERRIVAWLATHAEVPPSTIR